MEKAIKEGFYKEILCECGKVIEDFVFRDGDIRLYNKMTKRESKLLIK